MSSTGDDSDVTSTAQSAHFPFPELPVAGPESSSPLNKPQLGSTPSAPDIIQHVPNDALEPQPPRPQMLKRKFPTDLGPTRPKKDSVSKYARRYTGGGVSAFDQGIWRSFVTSDADSCSSSSEDEDTENVKIGKMQRFKIWSTKKRMLPSYSRFAVGNDLFKSKGSICKYDGRLNITLHGLADKRYLAKSLEAVIGHHLPSRGKRQAQQEQPAPLPQSQRKDKQDAPLSLPIPHMNIVIMVIGSRGDIQPFLKIGQTLQEYGHRVRIATHPAFKRFVEEEAHLEFFSVGGDPAALMGFMVKNPGLIPTFETIKKGEVIERRNQMFEMFLGFWRACVNVADETEKDVANIKMMGEKRPFVADAIIANPPSFAHLHIAEKLGIPLHLMFTFPYTPTEAFAHPLANIKKTNVDIGYANFMSYPLVDMMTWQGLGDLINKFRVKTLGLEPVNPLWAAGQLYRLKVPCTYLWSPGLVPKPADWGSEIDIAGYVFLDLAGVYKPPQDLVDFLEAGEPPVYIGFGSIVVDDPNKLTTIIFEAVKKAGVRALVSKGWGGIGGVDIAPKDVFLLDNVPHDYLFRKVRAVVHHGGAGTTAIGMKCGKPTFIVPFFGDQPFWGSRIANVGAGPPPIPYKYLTVDNLAENIRKCLTPEAEEAAQRIARDIEAEGDGSKNAVEIFHSHLPLSGKDTIRCSLLPERIATWQILDTNYRLSTLAADVLIDGKQLKWYDLHLLHHCDYNDFEGPPGPLSGIGGVLIGNTADAVLGVGSVPRKWRKRIQRHKNEQEKRSLANAKRAEVGYVAKEKQQNTQKEGGKKAETEDTNIDGANAAHQKLEEGVSMLNRDLQQVESMFRPTKKPTASTPHRPHVQTATMTAPGPETPTMELANELLVDTSKGVLKSTVAILRLPLDLCLAVAQGLHNLPRFYGDPTVRSQVRVVDFKSSLKRSRDEFRYGIYDGWTGLYKHPYREGKVNGTRGFFKGMGLGISGLFVKNASAIIGPVGYTFLGLRKQKQKHSAKKRQPAQELRRARITQGQKEVQALSRGERREVVMRVAREWNVLGLSKVVARAKRDGDVYGDAKIEQRGDRLVMM